MHHVSSISTLLNLYFIHCLKQDGAYLQGRPSWQVILLSNMPGNCWQKRMDIKERTKHTYSTSRMEGKKCGEFKLHSLHDLLNKTIVSICCMWYGVYQHSLNVVKETNCMYTGMCPRRAAPGVITRHSRIFTRHSKNKKIKKKKKKNNYAFWEKTPKPNIKYSKAHYW